MVGFRTASGESIRTLGDELGERVFEYLWLENAAGRARREELLITRLSVEVWWC